MYCSFGKLKQFFNRKNASWALNNFNVFARRWNSSNFFESMASIPTLFPIGAPSPAANLAINAASCDEIASLLVTSAAALCRSFVKGDVPATCCAILAASFELIPFCPVVFDSETV